MILITFLPHFNDMFFPDKNFKSFYQTMRTYSKSFAFCFTLADFEQIDILFLSQRFRIIKMKFDGIYDELPNFVCKGPTNGLKSNL